MKLLKFKQYLRESLEFNIEDIEDLFQDFRDNYYIIDIDKKYEYSSKNKKLVYPFPGKYMIIYKIIISPSVSDKSEICEDLSDNYLNIIKQLEAWGVSVENLTKRKTNVGEFKFENGLIYNKFPNSSTQINKVELLICDNSIEELTIDEWFSNLEEGEPIKLKFDYQEGSIGFSNFNSYDVINILNNIVDDDSDILEFISNDNSVNLDWSFLDSSEDDYYYEIGDLVEDYYNDFESLIMSSSRLKSDKKMNLDEMVIYLENNYSDLISEIFEYLLEVKRENINKWISLYLQEMLEGLLKVDIINYGVRIYFPNIDFIAYDVDSNFCEKFERLITNNISKSWIDFILGNIKRLLYTSTTLYIKGFNNKESYKKYFDFDFTYSDNKEIENIIKKYEN